MMLKYTMHVKETLKSAVRMRCVACVKLNSLEKWFDAVMRVHSLQSRPWFVIVRCRKFTDNSNGIGIDSQTMCCAYDTAVEKSQSFIQSKHFATPFQLLTDKCTNHITRISTHFALNFVAFPQDCRLFQLNMICLFTNSVFNSWIYDFKTKHREKWWISFNVEKCVKLFNDHIEMLKQNVHIWNEMYWWTMQLLTKCDL